MLRSAAVTGCTDAAPGAGGALVDDGGAAADGDAAVDGDVDGAADGVAACGGGAALHCTSTTTAASISAYHGPQPSWAERAHDWPIVALALVYFAGLAWSARRRRWSTWATAAGVFALALAAYAAGRTGSPLCRPDSLWQYHGAWHVLSAAAAGWAARAMAPSPHRPAQHGHPRGDIAQAGDGQDGLSQLRAYDALAVRISETAQLTPNSNS